MWVVSNFVGVIPFCFYSRSTGFLCNTIRFIADTHVGMRVLPLTTCSLYYSGRTLFFSGKPPMTMVNVTYLQDLFYLIVIKHRSL